MTLTFYQVELKKKPGNNVATAIFHNGCQLQCTRILINTSCIGNNCGVNMYVLEESEFKYKMFGLLRHKFPLFFKIAFINTNDTIISKTTSPGAFILTLLDSVADSDIKSSVYIYRSCNNRARKRGWGHLGAVSPYSPC